MFGLTPFRRNHNLIGKRDGLSPWSDIDRAFEQFFNDSFLSPFFHQGGSMKVDIKETDKEYIVEAEIPGVDKKDIQLELHDDLLTIQVQRNEQLDVEKDNYIRKERRSSSMRRSFYVENVKQEDVTAKYENGILSIVLPKREPGIKKGKSIDIQ